MSQIRHIEALSTRLDSAFQTIRAAASAKDKQASPGVLSELQAQCLVYAGFLSDLLAGKISMFNPNTLKMTELVSAFCALIEGDVAPNEMGEA